MLNKYNLLTANIPKSQGIAGYMQNFPQLQLAISLLKTGIIGGVRSCQYPYAMFSLLSSHKHSHKRGRCRKKQQSDHHCHVHLISALGKFIIICTSVSDNFGLQGRSGKKQ